MQIFVLLFLFNVNDLPLSRNDVKQGNNSFYVDKCLRQAFARVLLR